MKNGPDKAPIAERMIQKLTWAKIYHVAGHDLQDGAGTAKEIKSWRLNGPGIIDIDAPGGQPLYWDQLHPLYSRHIVHAAKIKIQLNSAGGFDNLAAGLIQTVYWNLQIHRNSETFEATQDHLLQMPYAQTIQKGESSSDTRPVCFERYIKMKEFFGSEIEDSLHSATQATVPGDPTNECIATLTGFNPDTASDVLGTKSLTYTVIIEYWVEFFHRVTVGLS